MSKKPHEKYQDLMETIRVRLDAIEEVKYSTLPDFSKAETAAFHGRKIIEGIAFSCLVATENGLATIPRKAKGQYNAEKLLKALKKENINTFPSPSIVRNATIEEAKANNVKVTIEGVPSKRITHDELIAIYKRVHYWLHELNPYVSAERKNFYKERGSNLWDDLEGIKLFIEKHFISIAGEGFFSILNDEKDNCTKVLALSKVEELSSQV